MRMSEGAIAASAWRLDGRVAAISGAAHGLGEATARSLAELGAHLVLLDVDGEGLARVGAEVREITPDVLTIQCDISDESAVMTAAATTKETFGGCDLLVNNAGVIGWTPLHELSLREWELVLAVNLTGYFLCTKYSAYSCSMPAQEALSTSRRLRPHLQNRVLAPTRPARQEPSCLRHKRQWNGVRAEFELIP